MPFLFQKKKKKNLIFRKKMMPWWLVITNYHRFEFNLQLTRFQLHSLYRLQYAYITHFMIAGNRRPNDIPVAWMEQCNDSPDKLNLILIAENNIASDNCCFPFRDILVTLTRQQNSLCQACRYFFSLSLLLLFCPSISWNALNMKTCMVYLTSYSYLKISLY